MNYVQVLNKLKFYQQKVFMNKWIRMRGNIQEKIQINELYKGNYIFDWQHKILLRKWNKKHNKQVK